MTMVARDDWGMILHATREWGSGKEHRKRKREQFWSEEEGQDLASTTDESSAFIVGDLRDQVGQLGFLIRPDKGPHAKLLGLHHAKPRAFAERLEVLSSPEEHVAALARRVEQLTLEVHERSRQVEQLGREMKELAAVVRDLRAHSAVVAEQAVVEDPALRWCDEHREELAEHPNSYIAVDVENGKIVLAEKDEREFSRKLHALGEASSKLFTTHTSAHV